MPSADYYKRKIATLEAKLTEAEELLAGVQLRINDRAALVSVSREGTKLRLVFVRNDILTTIETYASWDIDIDDLKRKLLDR